MYEHDGTYVRLRRRLWHGRNFDRQCPGGATVTVSKDGKTKTKVAGADGVAVFRGLATGAWTVTSTNGEQTSAPKPVTITADYSTAITFFCGHHQRHLPGRIHMHGHGWRDHADGAGH